MAARQSSVCLCKAALSRTASARVTGQRDHAGMGCPPALSWARNLALGLSQTLTELLQG